MRWTDIRSAYPDQWLAIEALRAHTEDHRRIFDRIAVIDVCSDGAMALRRYRELRREHPDREFCYAHTENADLEIVERPWIGIRSNNAPDPR